MKRVLLVFAAGVFKFCLLFGQSTQPEQITSARFAEDISHKDVAEPTHGTVNVFLANKNGLVVVTDSRLSNAGRFVSDNGQKLFRIDDRTICTIAGWYSDSGPVVRPDHEGDPSLPASLAVPQILKTFLSITTLPADNLERKADILAVVFASALKFSAIIDKYAGLAPNLSGSQITVAGFTNDGTLEILQRDVNPRAENGEIVDYRALRKPTITINENTGLVHVVRGIPTTAQAILDGTHRLTSTDPILKYLKDSLTKDRGASLSLVDMEQVAKKIERVTAQEYPQEVGGPQQIAELRAGQIPEFEEPIKVTYPIPKSVVDNTFDGASIKGVGGAFQHQPNSIIMLNNVTIVRSGQELDNAFVFRSSIDQCGLTYSGSTTSIFDKSNMVTASTLTLLPGADPDSQFVKQIKLDFPTLAVIDRTKGHGEPTPNGGLPAQIHPHPKEQQ